MTRATLYSKSLKPRSGGATPQPEAPVALPLKEIIKIFLRRFEKPLLLAAGVLSAFLSVGIYAMMTQRPGVITQDDVDAAVLHTLKKQPPAPSHASVAYNAISPSIVLVKRLGKEDAESNTKDKKKKKSPEKNERAKKQIGRAHV